MDFEKFYDRQPDYASFRNDPGEREYYDAAAGWKVRKLVSLVSGDKRFGSVLEVGCAFGVLLNSISDKLAIESRTGVDIASENIKTATEMWPGCTFFRGTLEEFEVLHDAAKKRFDLVILSDIVEHVPDDAGFMKIAGRMGSYVLLNLPLEKSFSTRKRKYGESDPSGHLRSYDRADAEKLVRQAGLTIVSAFTSIAFFDDQFYRAYTKQRAKRLSRKPLLLKTFWTVFYFFQDRFRRFSEKISGKIWGSNYFALLKGNPL